MEDRPFVASILRCLPQPLVCLLWLGIMHRVHKTDQRDDTCLAFQEDRDRGIESLKAT